MLPVAPHRVAHLYRLHFTDRRRERLFLSSVGFFTSFVTVRGITHAIRHGIPPFHNLGIGGRHPTTWSSGSPDCSAPATSG